MPLQFPTVAQYEGKQSMSTDIDIVAPPADIHAQRLGIGVLVLVALAFYYFGMKH